MADREISVECRGAGSGLRIPHIRHVLSESPDVPWFEVHICNFLGGGLNRTLLHQVNERYPLSFHGVSLNLAGTDKLDRDYLQRLKQAIDEFNPGLVSEHACFTAHQGQAFHDLLPVPFTEDAVFHLAKRVSEVQDVIGRQLLLENLSRYVRYPESEMSEGEFLAAVAVEADCGLLLDLNNAWVNQCNLGEDIDAFLDALPAERVGEIHLAGFSEYDGRLIDTHGSEVSDEVWDLFASCYQRFADVPVLIEWDANLPAFERLEQERQRAELIMSGSAERVGKDRVAI